MPKLPPGRPRGSQRWPTFLRNHARAIVACDFFVVVTATFRLLYVFVAIEHGARRLLHLNVTSHPTAAWTLQQLREALEYEDRYRYLIHDRDGIFAKSLGRFARGVNSFTFSPMRRAGQSQVPAAATFHAPPACCSSLSPTAFRSARSGAAC
jgi:hypothetical protein